MNDDISKPGQYVPASDGHIPVDTASPSAEWTTWCARQRQSQLAALDVDGRREMAFVVDEVLIDDADTELVRMLVEKHGAELLAPTPIPRPPDGLGARQGADLRAMPTLARLRFRAPPAPGRGAALLHDAFGARASVTSAMGAAVLGLVTELAAAGHPIGVNAVADGMALSLLGATEESAAPFGADPFAWPAYAGRARVPQAWQLVEAFRKLASIKPLVTVGVLDGGFWLNGKLPGFPPSQAGSDFGPAVFQLNLLDESVGAGGASPNKCSTGYSCPWHGNAVAGVATARIGNSVGSAGVGGSVAMPAMFKSELTISQVVQCLHVCLAWGIDILNMSFTMDYWEPAFPTSGWNKQFQFAADNGLIMVAAAGNDGARLPDDSNVRPATRTPGTITVGWLDVDDRAHANSNFGSSVDVWAPGTGIPVPPDPNNPLGSTASGTSMAAPFVSGVIAMMKAVHPALDTFQAKQLLASSGWPGTDRVNVGIDAYAAVLAAMGGRLPADLDEANDSPASAAPLYPLGPNGALVPLGHLGEPGTAALSARTDVDWYRFHLNEFSNLSLALSFYPLLGTVRATVVPDDPNNMAEGDLVATFSAGQTRINGLLAPGDYKLRIDGSLNLYQLSVSLKAAPIELDMFEPNDSFDKATRFHLRVPGAGVPPLPAFFLHGAGRYRLTIHNADHDFFDMRVDPLHALPMRAKVRLFETDAALDVKLYDADRVLLKHLVGVRSDVLELTPGMRTLIEISAAKPTRYTMLVQYEVDPASLPGPLQEVVVVPLPDLGDPPFRLKDHIAHFVVNVASNQRARQLVFGPSNGAALGVDLLDATGALVAQGVPLVDGMHGSTSIDTAHLHPGTYFLRLGAAEGKLGGGGIEIERLPSPARRA
jgi:hypothetical protein